MFNEPKINGRLRGSQVVFIAMLADAFIALNAINVRSHKKYKCTAHNQHTSINIYGVFSYIHHPILCCAILVVFILLDMHIPLQIEKKLSQCSTSMRACTKTIRNLAHKINTNLK